MIDKQYINKILKAGKNPSHDEIDRILRKAKGRQRLNLLDIAMLLNAHEEEQLENIYRIAGELKDEIYGITPAKSR